MDEKSGLSPSLEDYLEAILSLERRNRVARVKDIADTLKVQAPSVSSALRALRDKELINYEPNSFISLTEKGMEAAESVQLRHTILTEFLERILLLPADAAGDQACRIEHSIDAETGRRLRNCMRFIEHT